PITDRGVALALTCFYFQSQRNIQQTADPSKIDVGFEQLGHTVKALLVRHDEVMLVRQNPGTGDAMLIFKDIYAWLQNILDPLIAIDNESSQLILDGLI